MKKEVRIEGMSCGHCVKRVQNALAEMGGVSNILVDLEGGVAKFDTADDVTDEAIKELIEDAGYDVVEISSRS